MSSFLTSTTLSWSELEPGSFYTRPHIKLMIMNDHLFSYSYFLCHSPRNSFTIFPPKVENDFLRQFQLESVLLHLSAILMFLLLVLWHLSGHLVEHRSLCIRVHGHILNPQTSLSLRSQTCFPHPHVNSVQKVSHFPKTSKNVLEVHAQGKTPRN